VRRRDVNSARLARCRFSASRFVSAVDHVADDVECGNAKYEASTREKRQEKYRNLVTRHCLAATRCEKREQSPSEGKPSVPKSSWLLGKATRIATRDVEGNIRLAEDTVAQGLLPEEKGETTLVSSRAAREWRDHWRYITALLPRRGSEQNAI